MTLGGSPRGRGPAVSAPTGFARVVPIAALLLAAVSPCAQAAWPHNSAINLPVCTAAGAQSLPAIATDGTGGAIVAWQDGRNGANDIYAQHILPSGVVDQAWPANGRALCTAAFNQVAPTIVADGTGGAIVTWYDIRNGSTYDIYAQHVLASGAVDPLWPGDGRALCTAAGDQAVPTIVADGAGGAIVTWQDGRPISANDIYAQHVLASGTVDPLWPANGRAVCAAVNSQFSPTIAPDGAGGAIVTWHDLRGGGAYDIYAQHVLAAGAVDPLWPADGRAVCTAANSQSNAAIVSDGAGGAIVTWRDFRNGTDYDIYAQRVMSTGAVDPAWSIDGQALCTFSGNQQSQTMVSDGAGGALVAWQDGRVAFNDIYAQHVLPSGVTYPWPMNGRAICTDGSGEFSPTIAPDGAGGAIITWYDNRGAVVANNYDIYAQHVLATSAVDPVWPADGRVLSTAASDQVAPVVLPDGAGGALVAWYDDRSGANDIYAQRVARFGYLGTPEAEILSVHDLPNDQGGKVKVSWSASWLDAESDPNLNFYEVWRSAPGSVANAAVELGARRLSSFAEPPAREGRSFVIPPEQAQVFAWEYLGSQYVAHYIPVYAFLAATTGDSTGAYNPRTAFMVVGRNNSGSMYWLSRPDSGYSVDNLPPAPPSPFVGAYSAGTTHLHWGRNFEADLAGYRLYRGSSSGFVPGPGNLVSAQPDTGFGDPGPAGSWYKLSAVDSHGNESVFAILGPDGTTDVPGAGAFALAFAPPAPNPVRGEGASFRVMLPVEAPIALTLYDHQGRRVREVWRGTVPAGEHFAHWDGRDGAGNAVSSGIYFARLDAMGRVLRVRFAVLK